MCIPNFNFLAQFEGEIIEEQHFFEVKKGGKPHNSPPEWLSGFIFWYDTQLLIFYRLAEKGANFACLTPQHFTSKLKQNWILIQESWEPQKAHLTLLLNIHTKFQLPNSIWRGQWKWKNTIKPLLLGWEGLKWGWIVETLKRHI